jgi:predicted sulfurtransferase
LVATKHDIKSNELLNQPEYLTPEQWHKELKEKKEKAFLIDMRNQYE